MTPQVSRFIRKDNDGDGNDVIDIGLINIFFLISRN